MSHELRTPLNSLLILSKLLSQNPDENLTDKQVEFAKTIHSSGSDLLELINEILDLSKIESGTMDVDARPVLFVELQALRRSHVPRDRGARRGCSSRPRLSPDLPRRRSDRSEAAAAGPEEPALERAQVHRARIGDAAPSRSRPAAGAPTRPPLKQAERVIAFRVTDTGIGIPPPSTAIIFEAFQQADGTTSRRYGGTGLGLSISREIARLLGGEITLTSEPGVGSTFVLYLPGTYVPARLRRGAPAVDRAIAARAAVAVERAIALDESLLADSDVSDDRHSLEPGDRVVLIIENDLTFVADPRRPGPREGLQVPGGDQGRRRAGDGEALQARRHHARHRSAGPGRLDRPRPPEARSRNPAHPGAHHLDAGRAAARPAARRDGLPLEAGRARGARRRLRLHPRVRRPEGQEPAGRRGRTTWSARASSS